MIRPELCVGAIAISDGKILRVKRKTEPEIGKRSMPGGHVDIGESLESAGERELYEETGLRGKCKIFVGSGEGISDNSHKVILDCEVVIEGYSEPIPATDAIASKWIPLEDINCLEMAEGLETFLEENGYI